MRKFEYMLNEKKNENEVGKRLDGANKRGVINKSILRQVQTIVKQVLTGER